MARPTTSLEPPAANGMISVMDREGQVCARAAGLASTSAAASSVAALIMREFLRPYDVMATSRKKSPIIAAAETGIFASGIFSGTGQCDLIEGLQLPNGGSSHEFLSCLPAT